MISNTNSVTPDEQRLINQIAEVAAHKPHSLEKRLMDMAVWYYSNHRRIPADNLKGKIEFQEKVINNLLDLMTMLTERIQAAEKNPRASNLWLPTGFEIVDD